MIRSMKFSYKTIRKETVIKIFLKISNGKQRIGKTNNNNNNSKGKISDLLVYQKKSN